VQQRKRQFLYEKYATPFYETCEFENPSTKEKITAMVSDLKAVLSKTKGLSVDANI